MMFSLITCVSDDIIFAWLYDFPTKIGTPAEEVEAKYYMFNVCSYMVGMPNRMKAPTKFNK